MTSIETTTARYGAVAVALAPAVMFVALVAHPLIMVLPDSVAIAAAVEDNPTRWGLVHLLTVIGIALTALAFVAIRARLRDAGEQRYSRWALPWVIVGTTLYGFLPGLEFAPLAAARTGGDVAAAQQTLAPWFIPVLAASAIAFAVGAVGFAKAIASSAILGKTLTWVVFAALIVLAVSRFVPAGLAQFYLQAAAGLVALWPLAHNMWRHSAPSPALRRRPAPAT